MKSGSVGAEELCCEDALQNGLIISKTPLIQEGLKGGYNR